MNLQRLNPFKKIGGEPHIGQQNVPSPPSAPSQPQRSNRFTMPSGLQPRHNPAASSGGSRINLQSLQKLQQQKIAVLNSNAQNIQKSAYLNFEARTLRSNIATINSQLTTAPKQAQDRLKAIRYVKQQQLLQVEEQQANLRAGNPIQNPAAHVLPQAQRRPLTSFMPPNPAPFHHPQPPANPMAARYQPAQVAPHHRMAQNSVPQLSAQQAASPIKNGQLDLSALDLPAGYKSRPKQVGMPRTPSMSSVSSNSLMSEEDIDAELAGLEELDNGPDISAELAQLDAEVAQMRSSSHDKMDKALDKLGDKLNSLEDYTDLQAEQIEEKLDQQMDLGDLALEELHDNHAVVSSAMDEALGLHDLEHDPEVNHILAELGIKTGPKTQADRNFDAMMSRLEPRR